jgi:hypothetical protein
MLREDGIFRKPAGGRGRIKEASIHDATTVKMAEA